ncbi:transcriptional regulator [Streptomyces sp. YIM S03343]
MTVLRATPPPPLPVRDKEGAREQAWGGVSPMLTRLAAEQATGVLVRESGALHLVDGMVVHAESPFAPGVEVLLTARGTLDPAVWREAEGRAGGPPGALRLLADAGRLGLSALELCLLGALYDAAYFALAPSSTPGRFRYGIAPLLPALRAVPVAALERETSRRRGLLHAVWPDTAPDEAPLTRTGRAAPPPLTPRQRAVLERVDGVRTAPDIARDLGRRAFPTLLDVRRLVAAGVVVAGPRAPDPVPIPPTEVNDPDITLLKRLRDALEAL